MDKKEEDNMDEQKITYISSIINQYLQLENEIKELKRAIKERKYKYKLLEESILSFMEKDANIDSIKLSNNDHEIIPIKKEKITEVSRKNLMEIIEANLKNNQDIYEKIKKELDNKKITKKVEKIKVRKTVSSKLSKESDMTNELLYNKK